MPAPAILRSASARARSLSFRIPPREVLMKNAVGFIRGKFVVPDHAERFLGPRAVHGDVVGALQDVFQLNLLGVARRHLLLGEIGVVGEHGHAEGGLADLRDARADVAEADDADRLAEQLRPDVTEALDVVVPCVSPGRSP